MLCVTTLEAWIAGEREAVLQRILTGTASGISKGS